MPTVAVLCEFPTLLGGERSWLAALPAVREAGFSPLVLAPTNGPLADALQEAGVPHIRWSLREPSGHRLELSVLRGRLQELLAAYQPDLVHANSLATTRIAGPVVRDKRLVGVGHLRDIVRLSSAAVRDVNCMPRLLAVSEATRRFHVAQGIDSGRTYVLYNGVDLQVFAPQPRRRGLLGDLDLPHSDLVVVTAGQIGLRKGMDVFVELARRVLELRRDVHFLVVGERTSIKNEAIRLEADLRLKASHPPCRGHVHFLGMRQDMPYILARADLVVHAARQEPLGRVLLESAAAGKAIIATDVGGTCEIFPPGSAAAILVPPCEVDDVGRSEMLAAVLRLLDDGVTRRRLGAAARRSAEESFGATEAGRKLAQHYVDLLSKATTAP